MKKIILTMTLLALVMVAEMGQALGSADKSANKADADTYTVSIHVSDAEFGGCGGAGIDSGAEILTVTIAGKHFRLEGPTSSAKMYTRGNGLLNLGDYPAKLTFDVHKTSYESQQVYELLLPDKSTRKFAVVGQWE